MLEQISHCQKLEEATRLLLKPRNAKTSRPKPIKAINSATFKSLVSPTPWVRESVCKRERTNSIFKITMNKLRENEKKGKIYFASLSVSFSSTKHKSKNKSYQMQAPHKAIFSYMRIHLNNNTFLFCFILI